MRRAAVLISILCWLGSGAPATERPKPRPAEPGRTPARGEPSKSDPAKEKIEEKKKQGSGATAADKNKKWRDYQTSKTNQHEATYKSEGEARGVAQKILGKDIVKTGDNKWRSADGKWQYRAKPGDVKDNHVHLERINPKTGEVVENWHLRWPGSGAR